MLPENVPDPLITIPPVSTVSTLVPLGISTPNSSALAIKLEPVVPSANNFNPATLPPASTDIPYEADSFPSTVAIASELVVIEAVLSPTVADNVDMLVELTAISPVFPSTVVLIFVTSVCIPLIVVP